MKTISGYLGVFALIGLFGSGADATLWLTGSTTAPFIPNWPWILAGGCVAGILSAALYAKAKSKS